METTDSLLKYFFPIVVLLQFFGCDSYYNNYTVYEPTPVDPSVEVGAPPAVERNMDCAELLRYNYNGFYETAETGKLFTLNTSSKQERISIIQAPVITSKDFARVTKTYDAIGNPSLHITLTEIGKRTFKEFTAKNIDSKVAIIVNDKLIAAPKILDTIAGGKVEISGNFTEEEVNKLYNAIESLIYCKR